MRSSPGWGLVVVAALVLAGCGGGGSGGKPPVPFSNPPEISSEDGVLSTTLTVEPAVATVAGEDVTFPALYNGMYMPPVLRVQPGDSIQLVLRNYGVLSTNMHYHGLNVTPMGAGDNIFLEIEPGITFAYNFPIPADHAQGLYWYHPHFDPLLNTQIAGGMSGGLIIGNILAPFPQLAGIPERVMLLKDLKTENGEPVADPDPSRSDEAHHQRPLPAAASPCTRASSSSGASATSARTSTTRSRSASSPSTSSRRTATCRTRSRPRTR